MSNSELELDFRAVNEASAGPKWQALFDEFWPAYRTWFMQEGAAARPGQGETRRALRRHMPELMATYEHLVALAGGGDRAARFLGLYRPPPFLSGCTQAIVTGDDPALIRNYDYAPRMCDGVVLRTAWSGTPVIASADCLWGALDGMNAHGLAIALSFGGRRIVGDGFAITLILRYVLETCATADHARSALGRVPSHMSYNVSVVDAAGAHFTARMAPDRPTVFTSAAVATNHQGEVEWPEHARLTATVERERFLQTRLAAAPVAPDDLAEDFLRPPLYRREFRRSSGTLYTAIYRPARGQVELIWPEHRWHLGFDAFEEQVYVADYSGVASGSGIASGPEHDADRPQPPASASER